MMILKSTSRNYPDIMLPKIGESIVCGRSRESKLKDTKISKQHIRIIVIDSTRIEILQLGSNNSSLDDDRLILRRGHRSLLNVNSTFKFLSGTDYEYKLTMIKNDDKKSCSENTKKSSLSNNSKKIEKHWSLGLISSMSNPSNQLYKDDSMVIIEDKFPKARHHFLALPLEKITTLKDLSECFIPLLKHLQSKSKKFIDDNYPDIAFKLGFHAIPSMTQIHCHIISQDFDSPCLKNKKHWNSFNTPFFIEISEFISLLDSSCQHVSIDEKKYLLYLKSELSCHKCTYKPKNMPDLKQHLAIHN